MNPFEELLDESAESISAERLIEAFTYFNENYDDVSLPAIMRILMDYGTIVPSEQPSTAPDDSVPTAKARPYKPKAKPRPRKKSKKKKR